MRALALVPLLLATPAFADTAADLAKIEARQKACLDKDFTTPGMMACAGAAHDAADKLLNRVYEAAASALKSEGDADGREKLKRLVASERAWIAYRDAECTFQGASMLGGSGENLVIVDCLYQKTAERVKAIGEVLNPK